MANRTVKDAHTVHGTNPQYLVEKIIRTRIYESRYWKEDCFALTAELLVDKAVELKYIGGVYSGNIKPTPFLCLLLKMLQIQPDKDIIIEFIKQQDYKYVRALGALYLRLIGESVECYKYLEPLYNDYRKLKQQDKNGDFHLIYMDEFIDTLVNEERVCDIILPRLQKRNILVETNVLEPRASMLDEELGDIDVAQIGNLDDDQDDHKDQSKSANQADQHQRSSKYDERRKDERKRRHKSRSRTRSRERRKKRSHSRERDRRRSRSRDKERRERDRKHRNSPEKRKSRKGKGDRERGSNKDETEEIRQQNELRAKLGLQPLKP